jgi:hypothetical protein
VPCFSAALQKCESRNAKEVKMLLFSHRRFLTFAAAGALVFTAVSVPARAEELLTHSGPVGPHEAILTAIGSKRVIAFYEPNGGHCAVNAVIFDKTDAYTGTTTAVRVRVSLYPREMVHIDSTDNGSLNLESLNLKCGDNAASLAVVDSPSAPLN